MMKSSLKCAWGIIKNLALALYVFLLYELLVTPAILDWSVYGVLLTVAIGLLLIYSLPSDKRRPITGLAITFLLAMQGLESIQTYPIGKYLLNALFIFIVLLICGKILGKYKFRSFLVVFLTALVLNSTLDLSQAPLWTEFMVKWESPDLYPRNATVDYFPAKLVDVDGDGIKEIITQANFAEAKKEAADFAENGTKYKILKPEHNTVVVFKWNNGNFKELSGNQYDRTRLLAELPNDYIGFPFYKAQFVGSDNQIKQDMIPQLNREALIEDSTNIATLPFTMLQLNQTALKSRLGSLQALNARTPSRVVGTGHFLQGTEQNQTVTLDNTLKIWQGAPGNKKIADLGSDKISDIGTSEVVVGDVNHDGIDELLVTSETSHILKLQPEGTFTVLWSSADTLDDKSRFQKFRFEDFSSLGANKTPEIIALSKSNVRNNPTRYMTGYELQNGSLKQTWRVFSGLINLRAGDVDGDGQNELIGYMYRSQHLYVLKKHGLPVVPALYIVTGAFILFGLIRNRRRVLPSRTVGLFALALLFTFVAGCSVPSGPKDFGAGKITTLEKASDATSKLSKAFDTTLNTGKKFYFSGWAGTKIQKRMNACYYTGTYDTEHGYSVDARIFGQPFRYYRWGNDVYISEEDKWRKAEPSETPLLPFRDMAKIQPFASKAVMGQGEDILGKKCDQYIIDLNYKEALQLASDMGITIPSTATSPEYEYMKDLKMRLRIFVGKDDNFIYKYLTETRMPVPGAGSIYQETSVKFWKYNNTGIKVPGPEKLKPYLIENK